MQDVSLFWQLAGGSLDDPSLARALAEAHRLPIERRLPLLCVIQPALEHADAEVRAQATSLLSGASGRLALSSLLGLLGDADPAVMRAAVAAWRQSISAGSARWAHALFHPSARVRRAALELGAPAGAQVLEPYLLTDPACRDLMAERELEIDQHALPLLFATTRSGELDPTRAAKLVTRLDPRDVLETVESGRERSAGEIEAVLVHARPEGSDACDELFALLSAAAPETTRGLCHALAISLAEDPGLRIRAAASLRVLARARPLSESLLALAVMAYPASLGWSEIEVADRKHAALALYQLARLGHEPRERVSALLRELVPCKAGLDLRIAGALLRLVQREPYALLFECFSRSDVVAAFAADPLRSASLLAIADDSKRGRRYLMDLVAGHGRFGRPMLEALLAWALPSEGLGFVDLLEPQAALSLAGALIALECEPGVTFTPRKIDRLALMLARKLSEGHRDALVRRWLTRFCSRLLALTDPVSSSFGLVMLGEWSRKLSADLFCEAMLALGSERLERMLPVILAASRVGYGKELALAAALADHASPVLRAFSEQRLGGRTKSLPTPARSHAVRVIDGPTADAIARASDPDFEALMESLHGSVSQGLAPALARRPGMETSIAACVALLGADDDAQAVARQFERFSDDHPSFLAEVEARAVDVWSAHAELPLLGAAWLWRWEKQSNRVGELISGRAGLEAALTLPSALHAAHVWRATAECWSLWAARDRRRLIALDDREGDAIVELAIAELDGRAAIGAAEILCALQRVGSPAIVRRASEIAARLPDASDDVRRRLERIVSSRGLPPSRGALRKRALDEAERERIRELFDLDALTRLCREPDLATVEEAALRLVELGPPGTLRLAELLAADELPLGFASLIDSIPLWSDDASLERVRALCDHARPELRFRLALAFVERGDHALAEVALSAACESGPAGWFTPKDYDALARTTPSPELWQRLARSPHPHAYRPALEALLNHGSTPEDSQAVRAFLLAGSERLFDLRLRAARWLAKRSDPLGFPILLEHTLVSGELHLFPNLSERHVEWAVTATLMAGESYEPKLLQVLAAREVPQRELDRAWERMMLAATATRTLRLVAQRVSHRPSREGKLASVADTFAWGARIAPVLTGKRLRAHLTDGRDLGHTRLESSRIYVSALPIVRGDRHGRQIVEALILHELGHHRYHADASGLETWKRASAEHMFGLLNLVADEHLERNLRALDAEFGDRLKRLAAWAFQHSDRDLPLVFLRRVLGEKTFAVLSSTSLGLAFASDSVRVDSAALLREMERAGLSFVRFVRAVRMGLGDRHGDPLVSRALELFGKGFRKSSMPRLFEIARELKAIFGWQAALAEQYGGHESGPLGERDEIVHGDGIGDDEVQQEVERVIDPTRRSHAGAGGSGRPSRLWINVGDTPTFDHIHNVQPVPRDPAEHQRLAAEVRRHALRLRALLEELGLARVPVRARIQGTRVDRGRLTGLVLRGEPRVLMRRERQPMSDLFLGVAVDCSGSMQSGQSIDKARRFAVLLAEATRNLPGVDLRVFGFTDTVLYDAGDANRCAAAALQVGGGNNDAAALFHVASLAKQSRRTSRLLVMISDGLPTECSTAALRALVDRLERREQMCVAQVAVRPLEEQCFRHYVLLEEDDLDGCVRRFEKTVGRLVRRTLAIP